LPTPATGVFIAIVTHRSAALALVLAWATAAPLATPLVAQPVDTAKVSTEPLFTKRDLWMAGGFVATTIALYPADRSLARSIQRDPLQDNHFLRESADFFDFMGTKGSVYIGVSMYAVGRMARIERMADLGLHGTEALFLAQSLVRLVKGLAGRARPVLDIDDPRSFKLGRGFGDGADNYRSFPSGHAGMAFAAAAAVTSETSKWWPNSAWYVAPLMYGGATMVAISRMYDNRHWASDVIMGAAIGTFSGLKIVRYHHSHPNNRIDRWLLSTSVIPDGRGAVRLTVTVFPARSS
jgi:membrane-associated phospholipid phosphatase